MTNNFPKTSLVYPGCTLAVLVNAIATIDDGAFPHHQWGDCTYAYDGTNGSHAVIVFRGCDLVATLFDHDSHRSPFHCEGEYDVERFFRGLPTSHRPLAERCIGYWHMSDRQGRDRPLVTTAFWDAGEYLTAADPWPEVWEHGAHVLRRQLLEDLDEALAEWQENHGLSADRIAFARSLFQRKMARPDAVLVLEREEAAYLMGLAQEGPEAYEAGTMKWFLKGFAALELQGNPFREGYKALVSIGIQLPPPLHEYVVQDQE